MLNTAYKMLRVVFLLLIVNLACGVGRQPRQVVEFEQLSFEIQTATATVSLLVGAPTHTPDPNATATPTLTATPAPTATEVISAATATATIEPQPLVAALASEAAATPSPLPSPSVVLAAPLQGGEWDFETGFNGWINPFGESCNGSGLANGWSAFTTRDEFGSSCMNQTTWQDNVYSGESAQEITFAFVGNQAGVFKSAPTTPGHRYTVEAFTRKEFSTAAVEVALGLDPGGGSNWEAETVQWFPWREDVSDQWARTEETIVAGADTLTIFIKGNHPFPEPGGALRIDAITITDLGP